MDPASRSEASRVPDRDVPSRRGRASAAAAPGAPASVFVYAWLLVAATAAVFLAAGPTQGSLGIFLAGVGVALTFFPARVRVERPLWLAVGGLLSCASLSFLPARWFGVPPWREALAAAPAIHLPATVTPVPWETGFWLAVLGASCLAGLFLLAHPIRSHAVLGVAAAAVLACGVYAGLSIYAKQTGWHYPYAGGATFGFFPNRNHTATFLVTGGIIALGVLTITLREGRWALTVLVGIGMAACVAGLFFYSGSRGGVVFLVAGTLIWLAGLGGTHRNVPLLVSVVALALAAGILFLVSGGEARSRLLGTNGAEVPAKLADPAAGGPRASTDPLPGNDHDAPFDFRVLIYRDTAAMIKDAPVAGIGLGAFAPVFAQYRRASLSGSTSIHPESDWLMLAAEAGVPALVCALLVAGLLGSRLRGAGEHPFWPLRWGCVAAAAAAVLHGAVDVPAHRVALGWWILLLAGLGLQASRARQERSGGAQRTVFVLAGLGTLILGVQLIRAEWFGGPPLPPFAAGKARDEIVATFQRGEVERALEQARQAVATFPTEAFFYYQLGVLLLHFEDTDAEVDEAFRAQRLLNPGSSAIPASQGDAWITVDPKRTVSLWTMALERQRSIDRATGASTENLTDDYRTFVDRAKPWPGVQGELYGLATRNPAFALVWFEGAAPQVAGEKLGPFTTNAALLRDFSPAQRQRFLLLWYAKGDRTALDRFVDDHADWQPAAWPVHLRQLTDGGQFEQAVRETADHYQIALTLPPRSDPAVLLPEAPSGSADPVALFNQSWRVGNSITARRVLEDADVAAGGLPNPAEYWRLRAALAAQDAAWPAAWQHLKRAVQATDPAALLP